MRTSAVPRHKSSSAQITPAPGISNILFAGGPFSFNVNRRSDPDHAIEASTNLTQWGDVFITNSRVLSFNWTETGASHSLQRFYHVKLGPPLPSRRWRKEICTATLAVLRSGRI